MRYHAVEHISMSITLQCVAMAELNATMRGTKSLFMCHGICRLHVQHHLGNIFIHFTKTNGKTTFSMWKIHKKLRRRRMHTTHMGCIRKSKSFADALQQY